MRFDQRVRYARLRVEGKGASAACVGEFRLFGADRATRRTASAIACSAREPEWVPGVGWEPSAGTPNDNLTLFDFQGRAA